MVTLNYTLNFKQLLKDPVTVSHGNRVCEKGCKRRSHNLGV